MKFSLIALGPHMSLKFNEIMLDAKDSFLNEDDHPLCALLNEIFEDFSARHGTVQIINRFLKMGYYSNLMPFILVGFIFFGCLYLLLFKLSECF